MTSFAVIVSRFNLTVTEGLLRGAQLQLQENGIAAKDIEVFYAPGAFEIPILEIGRAHV